MENKHEVFSRKLLVTDSWGGGGDHSDGVKSELVKS